MSGRYSGRPLANQCRGPVRVPAPPRRLSRTRPTHGSCLVPGRARWDSEAMPRSHATAHPSTARAGDGDLVIRPAGRSDADALAALAALDSARALTGERLVAEVDDRLVAAVSGHDGRAIADPF